MSSQSNTPGNEYNESEQNTPQVEICLPIQIIDSFNDSYDYDNEEILFDVANIIHLN